MKKDILTKYLAVFLLICFVLDGILLCGFSHKGWWSNWMVTPPNLYMILGAFYCHFMKKNVDSHPDKLTWLYVYKGIKLVLTIIMIVLFIVFVKESSFENGNDFSNSKTAFVIITTAAYLVALTAETCVYIHYTKSLNKRNKA